MNAQLQQIPKLRHYGRAGSASIEHNLEISAAEKDASAARIIGSSFNPDEVIAAAFRAAGLPPLAPREGPSRRP
jgi:hypothetical protein